MKKCFILLLLLISQTVLSTPIIKVLQADNDTISVNKSSAIEDKVTFKSNLKEKYNDSEFNYTDDLKKPEPQKVDKPAPIHSGNKNNGFLPVFVSFMSNVFPFLLALIIVLIILKTFLGSDAGFWNFKRSKQKSAETLLYEDENDDIHETDFDRLLESAILNKNYRLATRYYYLLLLKKLSDKKTIKYHKDKTNTEYLFEINDKQIRRQFTEVSHIYTYVWYGEFPLDTFKFETVEKKYKSIFNSIN
ncbi:hypothetical protein [Olleya sp. HaHaR_3_96]|uniref:hypothetical protein n=1 Tax=Olleya sp. HaHaR_3_96 TaxID=2745560 RepID=UPI001C4E7E43|nr:hypothetical protein [Olleya sp. HaHaR_3_96]QXP58796.1 hypothetical protein H0I26_12845 [Olleya sp. HaHaR_3_96]